jgi:hypothetical protein
VELFRNFEALSHRATRHHYRASGILEDVRLVDAVDSVQTSLEQAKRQNARAEIFDLGLARFRVLRVPDLHAAETPPPPVDMWRTTDAAQRFDERTTQYRGARMAQEVMHAGFMKLDEAEPRRFGLA